MKTKLKLVESLLKESTTKIGVFDSDYQGQEWIDEFSDELFDEIVRKYTNISARNHADYIIFTYDADADYIEDDMMLDKVVIKSGAVIEDTRVVEDEAEPLFFYKVMLKDGVKNYAVSEDPQKLKALDYKPECVYCLEWKNNLFMDYPHGKINFMNDVVGSKEAAQEYTSKFRNMKLIEAITNKSCITEATGYTWTGEPVDVRDYDQDLITTEDIIFYNVSDNDETFDSEEMMASDLYDEDSDEATIPEGTTLTFKGMNRNGTLGVAVYSLPEYKDIEIRIYFDYWRDELQYQVKPLEGYWEEEEDEAEGDGEYYRYQYFLNSDALDEFTDETEALNDVLDNIKNTYMSDDEYSGELRFIELYRAEGDNDVGECIEAWQNEEVIDFLSDNGFTQEEINKIVDPDYLEESLKLNKGYRIQNLGESLTDKIDRKLIHLVQSKLPGPLANRVGDSNNIKFLKENSNKDDKLLKIDTLYRDAINYGVNPESLDKILYSNGADPDAPTFDIGLNVDKAYEELSDFLKKKYQSEFDRDYDDNEIPHDSYNILGFNKLAYKLELERLNKEIANLKDKYNINESKNKSVNIVEDWKLIRHDAYSKDNKTRNYTIWCDEEGEYNLVLGKTQNDSLIYSSKDDDSVYKEAERLGQSLLKRGWKQQ